MALTSRDRRALRYGAGGVALLVLYFFAVEPLAGGYFRLREEHQRLAIRLARRGYETQKAAYFAARLAEFERAGGALRPPRPYDQEIAALGEQIVAAAQQSGVQLSGATPTPAVPWGDDPTLALALVNLEAQVQWPAPLQADEIWANVFAFLQRLYRIPGVLSVERLDLASAVQQGGGPVKGGTITLRLTVSVLVQAANEDEQLCAASR